MAKKSAPAKPPQPQLPDARTGENNPIHYRNNDTGKEGGLGELMEDMKSPDGRNFKDTYVDWVKRPLPEGYKPPKSKQPSLLEGGDHKSPRGKSGPSKHINFID